MSIAILSYPSDFHAAIVEWALKTKYGVEASTIFTPNYPNIDVYSAHFRSPSRKPAGAELSVNGSSFAPDVVWRRRLPPPSLASHVHSDDADFVNGENKKFTEGFWAALSKEAFWINDHYNAARANSKSFQLLQAHTLGWHIPETLMSNNPIEIRDFVCGGETVYKPYMTPVWKAANGSTHTPMTSLVGVDQLGDDNQLRACAGIFQRLVRKSYELRVTIFGRTCFAMKIHSQDKANTQLDWRVGFYDSVHIEQVELPSKIHDACFALMDRLGLVYGALDVAVTHDGEYYFFEINEMGQFLWIEDMRPDVTILDAFCGFLASADAEFSYAASSPRWTMKEARSDEQFLEFFRLRQTGNTEHIPGQFFRERAL